MRVLGKGWITLLSSANKPIYKLDEAYLSVLFASQSSLLLTVYWVGDPSQAVYLQALQLLKANIPECLGCTHPAVSGRAAGFWSLTPEKRDPTSSLCSQLKTTCRMGFSRKRNYSLSLKVAHQTNDFFGYGSVFNFRNPGPKGFLLSLKTNRP